MHLALLFIYDSQSWCGGLSARTDAGTADHGTIVVVVVVYRLVGGTWWGTSRNVPKHRPVRSSDSRSLYGTLVFSKWGRRGDWKLYGRYVL